MTEAAGTRFAFPAGMEKFEVARLLDQDKPLQRSFAPELLAAGGLLMMITRMIRRGRREGFRDASVLITGGSRGLGLEMARVFVKEGARVTIMARSEDELEAARQELLSRGADIATIQCDLTDPREIHSAIARVLELRGRVDVLVNNAGIIQVGPEENMNLRDYENAMKIHAWAPLHLIRALAPRMKKQGGGRIVNITSIGGLVSVPHLLPYDMSKFALVGLSDGMRAELAKDGISVTTIAPGLMRTGSHIRAQMKGQHEKEFAWFAASAAFPLISMNSARAARLIVEACKDKRSRVILGWQARTLHTVNALFPGALSAAMRLVVRALPAPAEPEEALMERPGYKARPSWMPSILTRLADKASLRNKETEEREKKAA